ncbi:hypothetical protein CPT_Piffle_035 [Stenotrophomonas phage Piffle]|uniref:Uncharacterized protein n=2 Tax=Pokkenvirus TaxID=2842972 RepID=A0AAE7WMI2_9CAUD|nr:hypothetical protein PP761_gp34 [Stenotrophomonas phage Paxi]YP_010659452.1 hypothetical protein PP762_gp35 [Stenotrophomonas phage Piffle]QYW01805.1 hypothetical protein CPT_Paxi_034 [Stenotrophomonas phage Paxi]QYW01895.1 hypothetical protein CPT_Piffle_035 [Stenotrophomonas phage Piffle]
MSEVNLFEAASRKQLRFTSSKGLLTVEHLWLLPLTSANGDSLDKLAMAANRELRELAEDSFVESKPNPRKAELTLQLDILKHVIGVKQAENAAKLADTQRREQIAQIEAALAEKQGDALKGMSAEDLEQKLKDLKKS